MSHLHRRDMDAPKLKVDYNDIGLWQPIGNATSTWQNFLGTVTRNGIYFSIDIESWNKVTGEQKRDARDYINKFFEILPKRWQDKIMYLRKRWKEWRITLRSELYNPETPF